MSWKAWSAFLEELQLRYRLPVEQVLVARRAASAVCGYTKDAHPTQSGLVEDRDEEGPWLQLVWDKGRHHLEVDVAPGGDLEWFYRDRETDRVHSSETIKGTIDMRSRATATGLGAVLMVVKAVGW